MRLTRAACAAFVFAGAFYLLLIDNLSSPELYAGAGAAVIALVGFELAARGGLGSPAPRLRWVAQGWRAVIRVPGDIVSVSAAAVAQLISPRDPRGTLRAVPFRYGDQERSPDIARRALAEALGSLTPNTIVIGIDEERDLILVHQLKRSGGAESVDVLRLG